MTARDALARQQKLQDERRAQRQRTCARDDCTRALVPNSAVELCEQCWKISQGFTQRDLRAFTAAPGPPTGLSRVPDQPSSHTVRAELTVTHGCVLCGSADVARRDHLGRPRDEQPIRFMRQLVRMIPDVPHVTGPRCQACDRGVRSHQDKFLPILAWVVQSLGRTDIEPEDLFGVRIVLARRRGEPVPAAPARPWGHVLRPLPELRPEEPLSDTELGRLRNLLAQN